MVLLNIFSSHFIQLVIYFYQEMGDIEPEMSLSRPWLLRKRVDNTFLGWIADRPLTLCHPCKLIIRKHLDGFQRNFNDRFLSQL